MRIKSLKNFNYFVSFSFMFFVSFLKISVMTFVRHHFLYITCIYLLYFLHALIQSFLYIGNLILSCTFLVHFLYISCILYCSDSPYVIRHSVQSGFPPSGLHEHIGSETFLDCVYLSQLTEHYPNVDNNLRKERKVNKWMNQSINYTKKSALLWKKLEVAFALHWKKEFIPGV